MSEGEEVSPTQRTLKEYRNKGYLADICERFLPAGPSRAYGNRKDLFGLFDLIAVGGPEGRIIGVQCFTTAWTEHERKMLEEEAALRVWLESGGKAVLWGWRKLKVKRGGKAVRWMPRVKEVMWNKTHIWLEESSRGGNLSFQEIRGSKN